VRLFSFANPGTSIYHYAMELIYQSLLGIAIVLLAALLLYVRRWRLRFIRLLAAEKQHETNLRRELHDTTERLQNSRQQVCFHKELLQLSKDAILVFPLNSRDEPGPCSYANAAARNLLEWDSDEIPPLECHEIETLPEENLSGPVATSDVNTLGTASTTESARQIAHKRIAQQIKIVLENREITRTTRIITHQQHVVHVTLRIFLRKRGNHRLLVYALHNEEPIRALTQSRDNARQRLGDLFQTARIGLAVYDARHTLRRANPAWLRIFGCPSIDEMQQLNLFAAPVIPASASETLMRGENLQLELAVDFDNWISQHGFITNRRRKAFLSLFFYNLGRDAEQRPLGHIVQVTEITDLRENEAALALRNVQLQQARKMESIGMMTGGIAHDFNNILTPILGYSEISLDFCEGNDTLREFINEIHTATLRAKELVSQILIYSRQTGEDASEIHLIPIVKEVSKQQTAVLAPLIEVRSHIRTKEDRVVANATQMHQILTNLATNAAYAMRESGGTLDIQLTTFNMGWRHRQEFPQLPKGRYVRLTVKDTGPGIPEEIQQQIFSPFFSTKPHGEGTGMGLAVVQGIVEGAHGAIALESTLGEGATFHIALPMVEVEHTDVDITWTPPPVSGKTILFVDDEPLIAKMAAPLLTSMGYVPITCTNVTDALQHLEDASNKISLILTDHVMPQSSGIELARTARERHPGIPVVICTGYPAKVDLAKASEAGVKAILVKPATRSELGDTLAKVLNGRNLLAESLERNPSEDPPEDNEDPNENQ